jgi:nitronate monooxygenase
MNVQMKSLSELLQIEVPIIVAPMFLVSNEAMIVAACKAGATAAIPALNYRSTDLLRQGIQKIRKETDKPFGINLIVNKSNVLYKEQLRICCEEKVAFIITSLGSPEETIKEAHKSGTLVFCDVTDINYAKKVEALGADALIAVNKDAGGHAGNLSADELLPQLVRQCTIPVISAGGISDAMGISRLLKLGASGFSIGSIFIATHEAPVSQEYKQAIVDYGAKDIVMTTKLSGTPCTVIKTPYVEKIGTTQNWLERFLNRNKRLKKWAKALTFMRGMKQLRNAAFSATYKTLWCAGPSIENVKSIRSIQEIIDELKPGFNHG